MIRYDDFSIITAQAVIYTPDSSQFSQPGFLGVTLGAFASRYNDVQALPLPPEMPGEIPRVILKSSDNEFQVMAAPKCIVSMWSNPLASDTQQQIVTDCVDVLLNYAKSSPAPIRVGRLALVLQRNFRIADPVQELISKFCNSDASQRQFSHSHDFEIHNHKAYQLPRFSGEINSWVRCKTVTFALPEPNRGILVEQDINTREEDILTNQFSIEQIVKFFASAFEESQKIMELYFPGEA